LIRGEEPVFEGLLNYHGDILQDIRGFCMRYSSWAKRPRCQIHLHPSLRLWMEYSLADLDKKKTIPVSWGSKKGKEGKKAKKVRVFAFYAIFALFASLVSSIQSLIIPRLT